MKKSLSKLKEQMQKLKAFGQRKIEQTKPYVRRAHESKVYAKTKYYFLKAIKYKKPEDFEKASIRLVIILSSLFAAYILFFTAAQKVASHDHGHGHDHGGHEEGGHDEAKAIDLDDEAIAASNIGVDEVKAEIIKPALRLRGQIVLNKERSVAMSPRFSGVVTAVHKKLGDTVQKGAAIATVESVQTRSRFAVTAGTGGVIVSLNAVPGVFIMDDETFIQVADLDSVWIELDAPASDSLHIQTGQTVKVCNPETKECAKTTLDYVARQLNEDTQTIHLKATLNNSDRKWLPGSFVEARVMLTQVPAEMAIKRSAIQLLDDKPHVFVKVEEELTATPVELGAQDDTMVEIKSGLELKDSYISENSYIAKAELLKSTAAHEH